MRPLTLLLGILMGSTGSLAIGLACTWIVILLLPHEEQRFAPEHSALVQAIVIFTALTAATASSFYGELRARGWRFSAHGVSLALLVGTIWVYWPT